MTSPVAPMPNETPEQRQARLDAANRFHAELMARQRAAEQARMPKPEPRPQPMMPQLGRSLGSFLSPQQQGMTKSPFIDQSFPDGAVRADGPGTVPPWARFGFTGDQPMLTQPGTGYDEVVMPVQPQGGLTLAAQPAAPAFDINNAMNTFNQQLGERVTSGQMTLDQARAAQAEMTALQRSPNATREQATDIAQRQMQVGQYAPALQDIVVTAQRRPQYDETPVMPAPMIGDGPLRPTSEQLAMYHAGGSRGAWDPQVGVFTATRLARQPEAPQYVPPPPPPEKVQYAPQPQGLVMNAPQPQGLVMNAPPTGMALGGLMRKYY